MVPKHCSVNAARISRERNESIMIRIVILSISLLAMASSAFCNQVALVGELGKFKPLVGNWKGRGTYAFEGEALPFTAHMTIAPVLGGRVVQQDWVISFDPVSPTISQRVLYSCDADQSVLGVRWVSNAGEYGIAVGGWTGGALKIVEGGIGPTSFDGQEGVFATLTSIMPIGDAVELLVERMDHSGTVHDTMDVEFIRENRMAPFSADSPGAHFASIPNDDRMKALEELSGGYVVTDTSHELPPGEGEDECEGVGKVERLLGGHAIAVTVRYPDSRYPLFERLDVVFWAADIASFAAFSYDSLGNVIDYFGDWAVESELGLSGISRNSPGMLHRKTVRIEGSGTSVVFTDATLDLKNDRWAVDGILLKRE
jgi:hypothetical protein